MTKPSYSQYRLAKKLKGDPKADKIINAYEQAVLEQKKEINRKYAEQKKALQPKPIPKMTVEQAKQRFYQVATELTRPPVHHPRHKTHKYVIDEENKAVVNFVLMYFGYAPLPEGVCRNTPAHSKGLLLAGNYGSGKSVLLEVHKKMKWKNNAFRMVSAHEIVAKYDADGEAGIKTYLSGNLAIDDLGTEELGRYYGKQEDVLKRILELRYILFKREGKKTHATTNLDINEITERYGARIGSRLNEMFNILYLGAKADSRDFRKML